jgi:hypothetical protein
MKLNVVSQDGCAADSPSTSYTASILSPRLSLTGWRKLDTFFRGWPTDLLCRDNTLLIRLNIVLI